MKKVVPMCGGSSWARCWLLGGKHTWARGIGSKVGGLTIKTPPPQALFSKIFGGFSIGFGDFFKILRTHTPLPTFRQTPPPLALQKSTPPSRKKSPDPYFLQLEHLWQGACVGVGWLPVP